MYKITTTNNHYDHSATLTKNTKREALTMARRMVRDLHANHGYDLAQIVTHDDAAWATDDHNILITVRAA